MRSEWLMLVALLLLAGCAATTHLPHRSAYIDAPPGTAVPAEFAGHTRVIVVVFENESGDDVRANATFADFARRGLGLPHYFAVNHPSQPNYVAIVSGTGQGIQADLPSTVDRPHLGSELELRYSGVDPARLWKVFAEGWRCDYARHDAPEDVWPFARRHVPFVSFADVQRDPEDYCRHHTGTMQDLAAALAHPESLPMLSFVVPDLVHDGHDVAQTTDEFCHAGQDAIACSGQWLKAVLGNVPACQGADCASGGVRTLLIVTFDEDSRMLYTPWWNNVYFAALGSGIPAGGKLCENYSHKDLYRTLQAVLGIAPQPSDPAGARLIPLYGLSGCQPR